MALINDFMSLIYPRHCEACENILFQHETFICHLCMISLPKCDSLQLTNQQLHLLFMGRIPLVNASSFYAFEKKGRVQQLLHAIKYQHQKELAAHIGNLFVKEYANNNLFEDMDIIIPIPLHKKKLKQRGYNQSEWFAKGISAQTKKEIDITSLRRTIETSTQTKKKKFQRWKNVEGIFELHHQHHLTNKHVLLVDDVITTGATIEAAWQVLKDIEGIRLSVASIAFAAKF